MTERSNRTGRLRRNNSTRASRRCLSLPKTSSIGLAVGRESEHDLRMIAIAVLIVRMLCDCFKSRRRLEAEILVLRHQLNVLQQHATPTAFALGGPRSVHLALSSLSSHPRRHHHRQARNIGALASKGFCRLLALRTRQ